MSGEVAGGPVAAVEHLTVRYDRVVAVDDVTLAVPAGLVTLLVGRNGAGKSSLVRCLLGQQRASAGAARLFGKDAWSTRARAMARIGVVPESPDAPVTMTARQLAAFCAQLYPHWDAGGVLERLRCAHIPLEVPFGRLSKGERAQVSLALALAASPEFLVLDDPTLGLDPVARRAVFDELIAELADRGTSVFLTSHDLAGVEGIAERIAVLHVGRLLVDETLEDLKARWRSLRVSVDLDITSLAPLHVVHSARWPWGAEVVVDNFDQERFAALSEREGMAGASVEPTSLEDIFLALAGAGRGGQA
jgi:ABC-2 type transport system ATP-binding protein